jgi:hypothetical protein
MADETSSTEEKAEKDLAPETTTVKKKVAKKKSAKKKVAKKKATTKKKVAAKKKVATSATSTETASEAAAASAPPTAKVETKSATPTAVAGSVPSTAKVEAKSATPTAVAEASAVASKPSASAESKPAPSNVTVQTELKKNTTSEDSSMTTDSKSASGFWLKVTFWLVIIILGFMYIRSLALNPKSEVTTTAVEQEAVELSTAGEEDTSAASSADEGRETPAETAQQSGLESGYTVSVPEQEAKAESIPSDVVEQTAGTEQATDAASTAEASVPATATEESVPATAAEASVPVVAAEPVTAAGDDAAVPESEVTSSAPDEVPSLRDMHAESVSKILKEFDDLRNATRAEMEAMRNRIQAERELREAMAPPPPWTGRGYAPYGGYPPAQQGYSPYYGR